MSFDFPKSKAPAGAKEIWLKIVPEDFLARLSHWDICQRQLMRDFIKATLDLWNLILVASTLCRRFQMRDKTFHALNIIRQCDPACRCDFVSRFWPQTDEGFPARDVSAFFQFAEMQIQAAIHRVEPLFQRHEIKRAIDLQGGHYPKPERPVNGGVQAVKINR
jgi:hypothetical protein